MIGFFKTAKGKICIALIVVLVLAGAAGGSYALWLYEQPKFHDVTMELGEPMPAISEFLTQYADENRAELVTQETDIDLTRAGEITLTFRYGGRTENVVLTIRDTTAPAVEFQDLQLTTDRTPVPEDFIKSMTDHGQMHATFAQALPATGGYEDVRIKVLVTDASGNVTEGECTLSWIWLREAYQLELGDTLEKADLLLNPQKDEVLLDQTALDAINTSPVGQYSVTSSSGSKTVTCTVTVQDTTGPALKLKEVFVYAGGTAVLEDFVESVTDLSGEPKVTLMTELKFDEEGVQTVIIQAEDAYGNITSVETKLHIVTDNVAPEFSGLSSMTVAKHSSPDYRAGVKANDDRDGSVSFTYDASGVDTSKAGTYYVTYTAKDSSGNVATVKRKVEVEHDAEDTAALVASIADSLSDDPEEIRDYVRNFVRSYVASDWGGDDPTWYGFTKRRGNCMVYAYCLKAILDYKGYETQLIWVTSPEKYLKSHYWVIIKLDIGWRHIDATRSNIHSRYSLMNDEQRYETLVRSGVQRDWDRTLWPKCD